MLIKNRVLSNAKWIIACKIVQSLLQLVIGMLCARYLGPKDYGIINYAAAIVGIVTPIVQLGLNSTLVQEFIDNPEKEGKILGTALVMDLASSLACFSMVSLFVSVVNHNDSKVIWVCVLYSISLIFKALELLQYWFQYKLLSKFPSVVMVISYIFVSLYRIFLLVTAKSIYWFALVHALDFAIIGLSLLFLFCRKSEQRLSFSFTLAKQLFKKSKFYILSAMMVTAFQNTDHIMLKNITGDAENGYYTAAITSASVLQFVYVAIVDSMRPVILEAKKNNSPKYELNISRLYCITIYMALVQGIGFTVFARLIIWILYGAEYMAAAKVLQTLVWYIAFSYMGMIRNIWILAEGKYKMLWKINLAGVLLNIVINALLIPKIGAVGAAIASLLTQIFTNFILGFIIKPLRENNRLLLKGLNPNLLLCLYKKR